MNQHQSSTSSLSFTGHDKAHAIKSIFQASVEAQLPITVWRLPHKNEINIMVSFSQPLVVDRPDLETLKKGFIIAPFNPEENSTLFINSDFQTAFEHGTTPIENEPPLTCSNEDFLNVIQKKLSQAELTLNYYHQPHIASTETFNYKALVENGIKAIKDQKFQKVVPARSTEVHLNDNFDLIEQYMQLCEAYPNAFVSIVSTSEIGTWLGATPELLLEVNEEKFKTVALAGTQKRDINKHLSETAWTQKEIEEQALVSRYIINCFKKIRLREYEERGPRTTVAGNLLHLKTEFEVDMKATNFSELGTVMLDLLHPTSAVAGMPKTAALDFIRKHEGLDRKFYSGYLGPVQQNDQTNIFVNLRCLQLLENSALLYAGAGVTEDSNPEKELEETEMKFNTLLNILNVKR